MSQDLSQRTQGGQAVRQRIQVQVERLRQSQQRSPLGVPEIIGLGAASLLLLSVVFAYLYFLTPANMRESRDRAERDSLQQALRGAMANVQSGTDTQASIAEITQSLEDFENNRLTSIGEGRMALYDVLNQLIRRNKLRNTAGPTYTSLEALGSEPGAQTRVTRSGDARWQSVYPGIGVTVTVEGTYQSLRHFVRDIETSSQFIVIHAIELEGVTDTNAPVTPMTAGPMAGEGGPVRPGAQPGAMPPPVTTRSSLVSLRLDMAAYYQRAGAQRAAQPAAQSR